MCFDIDKDFPIALVGGIFYKNLKVNSFNQNIIVCQDLETAELYAFLLSEPDAELISAKQLEILKHLEV